MEIKNYVHQLYELRDEMKKAISNSELVEGQEKLLVKLIFDAKEDGQFAEFTKSLTSNWKTYEHDRLVLKDRLEKIDYLISLHEKQDENSKLVDDVISLVLEALGAAKSKKA